jgi:hypothetical protein
MSGLFSRTGRGQTDSVLAARHLDRGRDAERRGQDQRLPGRCGRPRRAFDESTRPPRRADSSSGWSTDRRVRTTTTVLGEALFGTAGWSVGVGEVARARGAARQATRTRGCRRLSAAAAPLLPRIRTRQPERPAPHREGSSNSDRPYPTSDRRGSVRTRRIPRGCGAWHGRGANPGPAGAPSVRTWRSPLRSASTLFHLRPAVPGRRRSRKRRSRAPGAVADALP